MKEIQVISREIQAKEETIFDTLDIKPATKADYLRRLPRFFDFMNSQPLDRDLLLRYKKSLRDDNHLGIAAKNKYLVTARIALREMYRKGILPIDLSVGVKSFQQSNKHKVCGLNEDEVRKICEYMQTLDNSFKNVRLRALLSLLLFQGLRQIEICRLNFEDIDFANKALYVLSKGREDRELIHLHPQTQKALKSYFKASQNSYGALFYSQNGTSIGKRLTTRGLRLIIQNLFNELEIDRTVHGMRHYFTTELIKYYKSDLTTVAKFTRHNSLEMLNVYNDAILDENSPKQLAKVFRLNLQGTKK